MFTHDPITGYEWFRNKYPELHKYLWELIPHPDYPMRRIPRRNCLKQWRADELRELEAELKLILKGT
jgi:hypothetical protein